MPIPIPRNILQLLNQSIPEPTAQKNPHNLLPNLRKVPRVQQQQREYPSLAEIAVKMRFLWASARELLACSLCLRSDAEDFICC